MKAYRIASWARFEKSDHKKCTNMTWVATPTSHDGIGFLTLLSLPDGLRKYGGWHLILQTAAKCPERGLLVADSGRVIDAAYIALKTRSSVPDIKDAMEACCKIGWLEVVEIPGVSPDSSGKSPEDSCLQDSTVQDSTVQDTPTVAGAPGALDCDSVGPEFPTREGHAWRAQRGLVETIRAGARGLDVDAELAKAAAWCIANPTKRKTARGMARFLAGWVGRAAKDAGLAAPEDAPTAAQEAEWQRIANGEA